MFDKLVYHNVTTRLRNFFANKNGFIEVPAQSRLSILAACEDPSTIATMVFDGIIYPLPQTGQMWLEIELLKDPNIQGVFCVTTSYRNEPNPIPGRHEKVFPMFEFESLGDIGALKKLEQELLTELGFAEAVSVSYEDACKEYSTPLLEAQHEHQLCHDYGHVISLEKFPRRSEPFWNMKYIGEDLYHKVDIILEGVETIGSAERSTDVEQMRHDFLTVSNGEYAQLLFDQFGEARVMQELEDYFALPMIERFGGGIGITRLATAMQKQSLL